ncbi:alcohol dehydrogenase family protein [Vibrio sp. SCSIO 43136]|uniref:alcohol dehydrogenase family protein n=1 Tax=Vibrio sp. SCSIO 43136 TaxID=2819101 RepID=UPI002074B539|nr:alcohol dehydrogenase family protein [Vibrio sp. SCSIO 43136]USD67551.1 alcohol dehydrogenase family protein [Vibrio sp. SCSIO 43136]
MTTNTMTGVQLVGHGGPEMLEIRHDLAIPTPAKGDVLIKVHAAGVNNTDINTRIGWYSKGDNEADDASWGGTALPLPLIQGADVCGTVVAVGEGVDPRRIGERVIIEPCLHYADGQPLESAWYFGSECNGGFAQFTKVAAQHAFTVNTDLTDAELASFPCSYSTAENLLTRSKVSASDTVLISGASGGVGSAAIQLAKARGAKVIAITSESKFETILALGTDQVVSRHTNLIEALGHNSIEVVIDLVGGENWDDFLQVLKPKGRYAVSGAIGGALVELDLRTLYLKDLNFFGCTVIEPEVFGNLVRHIEHGNIKPLVAQTYPLSEINQAQQAFQTKSHVGKIVLTLE